MYIESNFQKYIGVLASLLLCWGCGDDDGEEDENTPDNGIQITSQMVLVEGGLFNMGCTTEQEFACERDENPIQRVILNDFYISRYEVTLNDFEQFMEAANYVTYAEVGNNQASFNINPTWRDGLSGVPNYERPRNEYNHPVTHITWTDAVAYCDWLSEVTGENYRLSTEAEWEYAARGGNQSQRYVYSGSNVLDEVAASTNTNSSTGGGGFILTQEVGTKSPNELGIYDMTGNVWEWCQDRYGGYQFQAEPFDNPQGQNQGSERVYRGGDWASCEIDIADDGSECRVSNRESLEPNRLISRSIGFRVVRDF